MFSRRAYNGGPSADFPAWCSILFERHRYKVAYGGRGSGKSHSMAAAILVRAAEQPLRVVVARLTRGSINESVHELLVQKIRQLQMTHLFTIQQNKIYGPHGSEISFYGLRDQNVDAIRSYEGADIVWVEEAAGISSYAWETLEPTVRKAGSEIWVTFNPQMDTDATYKRFVLSPDAQVCAVRVNWDQNPWFPEVLRVAKDALRERDEKLYMHVYEGEPRDSAENAIFANEIKAALSEGRFTDVPYDRTKPVDVIYDLGHGDPTAQWFVQSYGGYLNFLDFYEEDSEDINHFVMIANQRGYRIRHHWLPWDAGRRDIHKKLGGAAPLNLSINSIMEGLGCVVKQGGTAGATPELLIARSRWPICRFDREKCRDGIQSLRNYQWDRRPTRRDGNHGEGKPGQRQDLHDWASHAAKAFLLACNSLNPAGDPPPKVEPTPVAAVQIPSGVRWL